MDSSQSRRNSDAFVPGDDVPLSTDLDSSLYDGDHEENYASSDTPHDSYNNLVGPPQQNRRDSLPLELSQIPLSVIETLAYDSLSHSVSPPQQNRRGSLPSTLSQIPLSFQNKASMTVLAERNRVRKKHECANELLQSLVKQASEVTSDDAEEDFSNFQTLDSIFKRIVIGRGANPALLANKYDILHAAFANLGWRGNKRLTASESLLLEEQLANIVYLDGSLSDFFANWNFTVPAGEESYAAFAKNLLIGQAVANTQKVSRASSSSFVLDERLLLASIQGENARLNQIVKAGVQFGLDSAYRWLLSNDTSFSEQRHYDLFQNTLLATYFSIFPRNELFYNSQATLDIPRLKSQGPFSQWEMNRYSITRFDLSSLTGLRSWALEAEDRVYAYGLVSEEKETNSFLFLPKSAPSSTVNTKLKELDDFYSYYYQAEKHHTDTLDAWLVSQAEKKVEVVSDDESFALAMHLAVKHPTTIIKVTGLDSTPLNHEIYERLSHDWDALLERPLVQVFMQTKVRSQRFFAGTEIYHLISNAKSSALDSRAVASLPLNSVSQLWLERVRRIHAVREHALLLRVDVNKVVMAEQNGFLLDFKHIYGLLRFPMLYAELIAGVVSKKTRHFYAQHKILVNGLIIAVALGGCLVLAYVGVLMPMVEWMIQPVLGLLNIGVTEGLTAGITIGLSVIASVLTPLVVQAAVKLTSMALILIDAVLSTMTFIIAGVLAGAKRGLQSLLCCYGAKGAPERWQSQRQNKDEAGSTIALVSSPSSLSSSTGSITVTIRDVHQRIRRHTAWKNAENKKIEAQRNKFLTIAKNEMKRLQGTYDFDPETDSISSSDDEDSQPQNKRAQEGSYSLTRARPSLVLSPESKKIEPTIERTRDIIGKSVIKRFVDFRDVHDKIKAKADNMLEDDLASCENYNNSISTYLKEIKADETFDKYPATKFRRHALNVCFGVTVIPSCVKSCFTGSAFFSTVGKSKEAFDELCEVSKAATNSGGMR